VTPLLASTFVVAREGFEAWLIAILAMTMAGTNIKQVRIIILAVIASIIATLALGSATVQFLGNHANIERFEALISVITGGLLAWVAWFCHGAAQHVRQLPYSSSWLLGLSVFGIMVNTMDGYSVGLGILVGLVILVLLAKISYNQIQKLPIRQIFRFSRWVFGALAVYFLYSGVHEIIEHGLLPL
jgi:high-affinity Fe2+/Pb2+ permease